MKSRSLILGFTAVVLLAVAGIQLLDLRWQRERVRIDTELQAVDQATALAEYVRGVFVAADSSLRQIAVHSRRIGGPTVRSDEWLPILHAARAALAEEGSLSVTDAAGVIRHSTLARLVGESRAESYVFRRLSQPSAADELVLDVPFVNPTASSSWIIPVGRRLTAPDGRFEGVVVQVITPEAFRSFFGAVRIGHAGVIKLFHPGGKVVIEQPGAATPAATTEDDPLFARISGTTTGVLTGPITDGGPRFVSAFRRVAGPELIITVSLNEHEFLANWRTQRRRAFIEFLALAAVMGVLVTLVLRQVQARSDVERALVDVQRTEAERLRDANERLAVALENEKQARRESDDASRLKDEFLMTLSHELRTPLNAVLGWLHILRANAIDSEGRAHALSTIERNAQSQVRLIEDLLDVSRAITGKLRLMPQPTDVGDVVRGSVATLQPAISARAIDFRTTIAEHLPTLHADPDRLQQVVWNLLSNAIKFSPPGGIVEVTVTGGTHSVEMVVRDFGVGIPASFLPFVFDRFRQADAGPRREHGGLGLGLAIARHLTELHGGTITAESEGPGRGSTFRVTLPTRPASVGDGHTARPL